MAMVQTHCHRCGGFWQQAQWRERKRSKSARKPREQKGATGKGGGALSPFRSGLTMPADSSAGVAGMPWVAASPQAMTPLHRKALPDGPETAYAKGEGKGKADLSAGRLMEIIQATNGLSEDVKGNLQKIIKEEGKTENTGVVKHSHLYRLENLRKSLEKHQERLASLDGNWKDFQLKIKAKYAEQRQGYMNLRKEIVESLENKQASYEEALTELKQRAEAEQSMSVEVEDLTQEDEVDFKALPWEIDLEMEKLDEVRAPSPPRKSQKLDG